MEDTSDIILLDGSAGGGKTRVGLEKAHLYALRYPYSSILFVRKSYSMVYPTLVVPFLTSVAGNDVVVKRNDRMIRYRNGSVIFLAGMLRYEESERIKGLGLRGGIDLILADEYNAFTKEDHEQLTGRLRSTAGGFRQLIAMTNPGPSGHWINKKLIQVPGACVRYRSFYYENTHNSTDYERFLKRMTGVMRDRLVLGEWTSAEGAVYPEFDRTIHVIKPFQIPDFWRRIRSIDFGYNAPFVCQWWAISPDGDMYLYREIYKTKLLVEDAAKWIHSLTGRESIETTIRDHDASATATLHHHGIQTIPASKFKTLEPGIQAIKERLTVGRNGKARLFLFEDALVSPDKDLVVDNKIYSTAQEFESYVYRSDPNILHEEPKKENDHGMDAMRYAVLYVDGIRKNLVAPPTAEELRKLNDSMSRISIGSDSFL